jgi:hypothetical protein
VKTLNSVEAYEIATNSWSPIAAMMTPRQDFGAVKAPGGRIYVVGSAKGAATRSGPSAIEEPQEIANI